ncbi:MAG: hypothetical protein COV10_03810 [Candidatus Vogelbacteria bacterium CG10_big_fil_rev_8_21_14_0_10_51_16]|uniref:Uncharacterized protein n=1 Tax=Candidatus Vogelbacteria bacterium CG10_big_fil_rev_8_21_14_0_10_51_16 TaxID=1975045 RepID=A0A2H0RDH5_9BACT|nr:MAG: hypothetical protein COV10_03810 [Candidatus Vogelbacteria bacterium CG10_big_fil_rev_8_21_14_0_10_51_16]
MEILPKDTRAGTISDRTGTGWRVSAPPSSCDLDNSSTPSFEFNLSNMVTEYVTVYLTLTKDTSPTMGKRAKKEKPR